MTTTTTTRQIRADNAPLVGGVAAALIALSTLLPWWTISVPLMGNVSFNGYQDGASSDGIYFLVGVAIVAICAVTRHRWVAGGWAALLVLGVVAETIYCFHITSEARAEAGDWGDAIQGSPGIGLILMLGLSLATAVWGLLDPESPFRRKQETAL